MILSMRSMPGRTTPAEMSFSDVPRRYQRVVRSSTRQQRGTNLVPFGRSGNNLSERGHPWRNHEGHRAQAPNRRPYGSIADGVAETASRRPWRQDPANQRSGGTRMGEARRRAATCYG